MPPGTAGLELAGSESELEPKTLSRKDICYLLLKPCDAAATIVAHSPE